MLVYVFLDYREIQQYVAYEILSFEDIIIKTHLHHLIVIRYSSKNVLVILASSITSFYVAITSMIIMYC